LRDDATAAAHPLKELSRFIERQKTHALKVQQLPPPTNQNDGLKLVGTNTLVTAGAVRILPLQTLKYIWYDVPDVREDAIAACGGSVNRATFDNRYPPGTLLCETPEQKPTRSTSGRVNWQIVYNFLYLNNGNTGGQNPDYFGHNYFLTAQGNFVLATF